MHHCPQTVKKIIMKSQAQNTSKAMKIGIAADHAGFLLKNYVKEKLRGKRYEVIDYGDNKMKAGDDYPDYVVPLAFAVANGAINRGIAICGSGVGACIVANKVKGIRACLINEEFSAQQGVEDDDMNIICLGARVINERMALKLINVFLAAEFSGKARHKRRIEKIKKLECDEESNVKY